MELTTLKSHIKLKTLDPYYIFTGPEIKVMDIYLEQMSTIANSTIKHVESLEELVKKRTSKSFVKSACIYVLRDSKEFVQDIDLARKITQYFTSQSDILVLIYTSIDKRSKVYKEMQDHIIEFAPMRIDVLVKYIQRDFNLSDDNAKLLAETCEKDYSRVLLELDKIKQYMNRVNSDDTRPFLDANLAFHYLLDDGTIYQPPKDAVFAFVDAVLTYHPKKAFELLRDSYEYGEATLVLLSNLYNSTKQLLQVQSYKGDDKITDATGLTPFQVKLALDKKGYYSNGDLVYLMRLVRDAEKGIKTGEIDEYTAVYYVLVNLWS